LFFPPGKIVKDENLNNAKIRKGEDVVNTSTEANSNSFLEHSSSTESKNKNSVQYILIRANSKEKILQTISILRTRCPVKLLDTPKAVLPIIADGLTEEVMNNSIKNRSKCAAVLRVEINNVRAFLQELKKLKVPAHIVVITTKYKKVYKKLSMVYPELDEL